jgi:hypothetical protein
MVKTTKGTKMKQTQFDRLVIISAERQCFTSHENRHRTINLGECQQVLDINYTPSQESYKGSNKQSFVVLPRNDEELQVLKDLAFNNFFQESILFRDYNGQASLIYGDDTIEELGPIKQVSPKLIEQLESYTVMNGNVYTTEEL